MRDESCRHGFKATSPPRNTGWVTFETPLEKIGTVRNLHIQIRGKEGDPIDCLLSADSVSINDQPCVLIVLRDITERKRSATDLIEAIETVMRDTSWFSRTVIEKLASLRQPRGSNAAKAAMKDLTPGERDVLGLLCQGHADDAIAETLGLSRYTVRNQVSAIYNKVGVHRRSAVIVLERERGFTSEVRITKSRDKGA